MGSFVFIPSVYLACEFGSRSVHLQALPADKTLLGAAVVALAIVPFYAFSRQWRAGVSRAWWTLRRPGELGARVEVGRSLLSACLAVAVASSVVELTNMNHGQWLIWSALSVITADLASSRAKSRDRMIAALWGVPAGIVLGSLVLPSIYSIAAFGLLGGLSLTCVPRYSLAYGLRTLAAVGGLILAGCSAQESAWRLVNGLLGVVIGATSMAVFYCGRPANAAQNEH